MYVPFAPLAQIASPVAETVTLLVGLASVPLVHAPQLALCGVTVVGDMLQIPVAVNWTDELLGLAVAGGDIEGFQLPCAGISGNASGD